MAETGKTNIGVYIHVPFCEKKCRYCGFLSFPGYPPEMYERFTAAAEAELASFNEGFTGSYVADTVFIGGGTPSLLSGEQAARLVRAAENAFGLSEGAEITIEANPNSLDPEKLAAYRKAGVTRLSMGAQSFSDTVLSSLGRVHRAAEIERAFNDARSAGFDDINLDLMFAVPGQSMDDVLESAARAAELGPEHISLYGLQLEEDTIFYEEYKSGLLDLPDEAAEEEMYHRAVDLLKAAGYEHYEISNFAMPGKRCRHNMKYWELCSYIGVGPGAHSYLRGTGLTGERRRNVCSMEDYLALTEQGKPAVDRTSVTVDTKEDAMSVFVFTGLRKLEGIDLAEFERLFGIGFFKAYRDKADVVKEYIDEGMMKLSGNMLSITEKGIYISNDIMSEFV